MTLFSRWKSNDYNDIMIVKLLENACTNLLAKEKTWKRIFNTNSELNYTIQNNNNKLTI